jgi:hypothetical protein
VFKWLGALAVVLTTVVIAVPVQAQSTDPAAAEVLFREGRAAMEKRDFETACERFRDSQRLDPAAGTVLNLAVCEAQRGRIATAWALFREVEQSASADFQAEAKKRAAALLPRLPQLTLLLPETDEQGQPVKREGLALLRNGSEVGASVLGVELPNDPGPQTFTLRIAGREESITTVTMKEGEKLSLTLKLGAPKPEQAADSDVPGLAIAGFVVGGAGLASLGAAIATGVAMLDRGTCFKTEDVSPSCVRTEEDRDAGQSLETASSALFIAGGILTAGGLALVLAAPWSSGEEAVSVAIGFGHAQLSWRFE